MSEGEPAPDQASALRELRRLLVGELTDHVSALEGRLDDPEVRAREVGALLPRAVEARGAGDEELTRALAPTSEAALHASVRRDPRAVADALYPALGPAIRKSIVSTISRFLESVNETLERSVSWEGLRWRVQAVREGRSFAEVALRHSLIYRVEQVFLIHRETGLPLLHVLSDPTRARDETMVAGMLTAIQDFVRDSFAEQEDELETVEVGDLEVWIERGSFVALAAVIRGDPPVRLRESLLQTVERVEVRHAADLGSFEGDSGPFEVSIPELESCLETEFKERPRGSSWAVYLFWAVLVGLVLWFSFRAWREQVRFDALVQALSHEPGLVIVGTGRTEDGVRLIEGLVDPHARPVSAILSALDVGEPGPTLRLRPYLSLEPGMVLARARRRLDPPGSVSLELEGGVLRVTGEASPGWAREARGRAAGVPGVTEVQDGELRLVGAEVPDSVDALAATLGGRLESLGARAASLEEEVLRLTTAAQESARWQTFLEAVRGAPGYRLLDHQDEPGALGAELVRDPLAPEPATLLEAAGLAPARVGLEVREEPSDHPPYVLRRARDVLAPPKGVVLSFEGGRLRAAGEAPAAWASAAALRASSVPGVTTWDGSDLGDPVVERLAAARRELEAEVLLFPSGAVTLPTSSRADLDRVRGKLRDLAALVSAEGRGGLEVAVVGHTDSDGDPAVNVEVSRLRGRHVAGALRPGLPAGLSLRALGVGSREPVRVERSQDDKRFNRSVTFKVQSQQD